jgi:hypothetical protein
MLGVFPSQSVAKTDEGHLAFLRLNFFAPGVPLGKDVPGAMHLAFQQSKEALYIRTINIKSKVCTLQYFG